MLPLFDDPNIARELGTRHRASLGISTVSDSITLVVSEETGTISYAQDGKLTRHIDHDSLEALLNEHFNPQESKGFLMFNPKKNDDQASEITEGKEENGNGKAAGKRKKKNKKR